MEPALKIKLLRGDELPFPAYQSAGAAGIDLVADVERAVTLGSLE